MDPNSFLSISLLSFSNIYLPKYSTILAYAGFPGSTTLLANTSQSIIDILILVLKKLLTVLFPEEIPPI